MKCDKPLYNSNPPSRTHQARYSKLSEMCKCKVRNQHAQYCSAHDSGGSISNALRKAVAS